MRTIRDEKRTNPTAHLTPCSNHSPAETPNQQDNEHISSMGEKNYLSKEVDIVNRPLFQKNCRNKYLHNEKRNKLISKEMSDENL